MPFSVSYYSPTELTDQNSQFYTGIGSFTFCWIRIHADPDPQHCLNVVVYMVNLANRCGKQPSIVGKQRPRRRRLASASSVSSSPDDIGSSGEEKEDSPDSPDQLSIANNKEVDEDNNDSDGEGSEPLGDADSEEDEDEDDEDDDYSPGSGKRPGSDYSIRYDTDMCWITVWPITILI